MKNFIVYHNPDSMGYSAREVSALSVLTNRKVSDDVIGSRVWLITGEGRPRKYYLCLHFIINSVDSGLNYGFHTMISGSHGKILIPMAEIGLEPWFKDFRRSQGNFAWGFQPIKSTDVVTGLETLA